MELPSANTGLECINSCSLLQSWLIEVDLVLLDSISQTSYTLAFVAIPSGNNLVSYLASRSVSMTIDCSLALSESDEHGAVPTKTFLFWYFCTVIVALYRPRPQNSSF